MLIHQDVINQRVQQLTGKGLDTLHTFGDISGQFLQAGANKITQPITDPIGFAKSLNPVPAFQRTGKLWGEGMAAVDPQTQKPLEQARATNLKTQDIISQGMKKGKVSKEQGKKQIESIRGLSQEELQNPSMLQAWADAASIGITTSLASSLLTSLSKKLASGGTQSWSADKLSPNTEKAYSSENFNRIQETGKKALSNQEGFAKIPGSSDIAEKMLSNPGQVKEYINQSTVAMERAYGGADAIPKSGDFISNTVVKSRIQDMAQKFNAFFGEGIQGNSEIANKFSEIMSANKYTSLGQMQKAAITVLKNLGALK